MGPWLLLLAILLGLGALKIKHSIHADIEGGDGGYYLNVAAHVRDGHGLASNISRYHKGYKQFPHPSSIYPLWPLALGYVSKLVPIHSAAVWLPTITYFIGLLFAFAWARRAFPGELAPSLLAGFEAAHVLVLLLGLPRGFIEFTSLPYTEGPSYALLFAALLRFHFLWQKPSWKSGAEMGIWFGVMVLTRSQLLLAPLAAAVTFAWFIVTAKKRRSYLLMFILCCVTFAATLLPHFIRMTSIISNPSLSSLLRFEVARVASPLSEIQTFVPVEGLWDFVTTKLRGVALAFDYGSKRGYDRQYYIFHYALLGALVLLIVRKARSLNRPGLTRLWSWATSVVTPEMFYVSVLGLGAFASLQLMQKQVWHEWNFHTRHAISCIPLFFLSYLFLIRSPVSWIRGICILFLGAFIYAGVSSHLQIINRATKQGEPWQHISTKGPRRDLKKWLNDRSSSDNQLTVATQQSNYLWQYTPHVNYRWIYKGTTMADILHMVHDLDADYVIIHKTRKRPLFFHPRKRFLSRFQLVAEKSNTSIYMLKKKSSQAGHIKASQPVSTPLSILPPNPSPEQSANSQSSPQ